MEGDLLDIEAAARFLGVSTTSLRRWTNSGRLGCVRVGGRRERRFRLADLTAFLEEQPARPVEAAPPQPADHVSVGGMTVPYGTHLCGFYSSDAGRVKLAVAFLAGGLGPGSVCFLVADPDSRRDILANLGMDQKTLQDHGAAGRLVVGDYRATGSAHLDYWQAQFVAAIARGAHTLRVVGDLWALARHTSREQVQEYERTYDQVLSRRFPVVTLCLYDTRRFSTRDAVGALRVHGDGFRYPVERWLA